MSTDKFFMAILSHKGSTHRDQQRRYLLEANKGGNFFIYYFIGDPSLSEDYSIDEENQIVYLKVPDNYESLPQKTHGAIKFAHTNFKEEIKGMIKTDDDIDINLDKLYGFLTAYGSLPYFGITAKITNPDNFSTWHIGKCESEELNRTPVKVPLCEYCAGGGYYLNTGSMEKASESGEIYRSMVFEDAATGFVLNSHGIYPHYMNMSEFGFSWPNMNPTPPPTPSVQNPLRL
jgi:hypothetical protein